MRKLPSIRASILSAIVIGGCGVFWLVLGKSSAAVQDAARRPADRPVPIIVCTALRRDVPVYRTGVGAVRPANSVAIVSRVEGEIVQMLFNEGANVKAGQPLVKIDDRRYVATLRQMEAALKRDEAKLGNARADYGRTTELVRRGISSEQTFLTQQSTVLQLVADVESSTAQRDKAALDLELTTIRAPFSGRIGLRHVDVGTYVKAGDQATIAVLNQLQPIFVTFTLPGDAIGAVTESMTSGPLQVSALARDMITTIEVGTLASIEGQIDQKTGTFKLKASFGNERSHLWPGQFVNARLLLSTRQNALVVPEQAIQRGPHGTYAFVVVNGRAEVRPVAISMTHGGVSVIDSGVSDGDVVVVDGHFKLQNNSAVRIVARADNSTDAYRDSCSPAAQARR